MSLSIWAVSSVADLASSHLWSICSTCGFTALVRGVWGSGGFTEVARAASAFCRTVGDWPRVVFHLELKLSGCSFRWSSMSSVVHSC
jgi:hypothetical protein